MSQRPHNRAVVVGAVLSVGATLCVSAVVSASPNRQTVPADPSATPAPAGPTTTTTAPPTPEELDGRDRRGKIVRISPALDGVPVFSVTYEGLGKRLAEAEAEQAAAQARADAARMALTNAESDATALVGLLDRASARTEKFAVLHESYLEAHRQLRVEAYTRDRFSELLEVPTESADEGLQRTLREGLLREAGAIVDRSLDGIERRTAAHDDQVADWNEQVASTESRRASSEDELAAALIDATDSVEAIDELTDAMAKERPTTVVNNSDLPLVALDAYWRAANYLALASPQCSLPWWALAGIGRTESNHGRSGGAQVQPDGLVTVPIIGIPLDGTNDTRAIGDSDMGLLDGDIFWDRAVGPMQFIPTTWATYATDGSGDGVADPQNLYDAAVSAGRLLCSTGSLLTEDGLRGAFRRYNNSGEYVDLVWSRATEYAALPVPIGLVTHPLTPIEVIEVLAALEAADAAAAEGVAPDSAAPAPADTTEPSAPR